MIEELTNKYAEFKNVLDVLPSKTKYNRQRKMSCIEEEEKNTNDSLAIVQKEIEKRISSFSSLQENPKIKSLESELEKCNIVNEWNSFNTSYEKMHLDYYLYQLHRYYKEDLESVNTCIKRILESFNKVEVPLSKEEFDFNNYAMEYMDKVISNASNEELATLFEDLYWKNPDIIKTIEINFKSIYLKYEKKINKYYETRHEEFLKTHKDEEIYKLRIDLSNKIRESKGNDIALNYQKFMNNEYRLSDFNTIDKVKEKYFTEDSYNYSNLDELRHILSEYNILIVYKYLFDNMKEKLDKKEGLKNSRANALKKINADENKLKKLNNKQNKKPLFGKKKNDEKWLFEYKKILNDIFTNYDEFDNACFDDLVFSKLSKDSSILDVLKLICSNYLYFVNRTNELDDGQDITEINNKYEALRDYVNTNDFYLLNNIALLDEKQMKQLIIDKYTLESITLTIDNLTPESIEGTINDINTLINYEFINNSGLNLDDLSLFLDYSKIKKEEPQQ